VSADKGDGAGPDKATPKPETAGSEIAGDPEIAAAARPRGGRAKKAAPSARKAAEADENPSSTVTPPPRSPTIARINPKPPAD
jgi:hypothetical protein